MFEQFENVTNAEAYLYAFHELLMRPFPGEPHRFIGNSQREDFLPLLEKVLSPYRDLGSCAILDVGAGSGEVVDMALHAIRHVTLSIEEPNRLLLDRYRQRIRQYPHIVLGGVYPRPVQDLYQTRHGKAWLRQRPDLQVVLAIHMIYHLTPFDGDAAVDPESDLLRMIAALYGKLAPGGTLFLVYAEQLESMLGQVSYQYFRLRSPQRADNLDRIWHARKRLLREGALAPLLDSRFPGARSRIEVTETRSRLFGYTHAELAAMCLAGEMGTADDNPFDVAKLHFALDMVTHHGSALDIAVETKDGPRKHMVSGSQPQVVCTIRKSGR